MAFVKCGHSGQKHRTTFRLSSNRVFPAAAVAITCNIADVSVKGYPVRITLSRKEAVNLCAALARAVAKTID